MTNRGSKLLCFGNILQEAGDDLWRLIYLGDRILWQIAIPGSHVF